MKKLADRYNKGKRRWSLVDFKSFEPMVEVLEYGCIKYDEHNWKKGLKVTETIDSLLRHTFALLRKEDVDPESLLAHIGHIQCNAMFLGYMLQNYPELDDRFSDPNYITETVKSTLKSYVSNDDSNGPVAIETTPT